jgi:hypothetical protein
MVFVGTRQIAGLQLGLHLLQQHATVSSTRRGVEIFIQLLAVTRSSTRRVGLAGQQAHAGVQQSQQRFFAQKKEP